MELRQLRYFAMVAQELSFTRAAQKLHISQPPLSFQINNLEVELGAILFHRTSRSVELSEAGKALLPHARAILERVIEARHHVGQVSEGLEGRIKIGLAGSHFLGPLPNFISKFRSTHPNVNIELHEMMPADHLQALYDGRVDISILRNPLDSDSLENHRLWSDPSVVALPIGHRLAARKNIKLSELRIEPFVLLKPSSSIYAQKIFDACIAQGFMPQVSQQVVEIPAAVNLVAAGMGISIVPSSLALIRKSDVIMCKLIAENLSGDVYASTRQTNSQSTVTEFIKNLEYWVNKCMAN